MSKKIAAYLSALVIAGIFILSGCSEADPSPYGETNTVPDVSLEVTAIDYDENQITLSLINETDSFFYYDTAYSIEKEKDGNWYTLNPDQSFTAIGCVLEPASSDELILPLEIKLKSGEYRIVKSFTADKDTAYLSADFTVS